MSRETNFRAAVVGLALAVASESLAQAPRSPTPPKAIDTGTISIRHIDPPEGTRL